MSSQSLTFLLNFVKKACSDQHELLLDKTHFNQAVIWQVADPVSLFHCNQFCHHFNITLNDDDDDLIGDVDDDIN